MKRRNFIKHSCCGAMASTSLVSALSSLFTTGAMAVDASAALTDYKALVCVMLAGGNDSFNMLIPTAAGSGDGSYMQYATSRSGLAIGDAMIHDLSGTDELGVHPAFGNIRDLYDSGDVAFVANVGTLVDELDGNTQYFDNSYRKPLSLQSHNDQIQQWQTGLPNVRDGIGWGGKMVDLMESVASSKDLSISISLAGNNYYQSGRMTVPYSVSKFGTGALPMSSIPNFHPGSWVNDIRRGGINDYLSQSYVNAFEQTFAEQATNAIDAQVEFSEALEANDPFIAFPANSTNPLMEQFHMIAKTIRARERLGMKRQLFFVQMGGWDQHDELFSRHEANLEYLDQALSVFYEALEEIDMASGEVPSGVPQNAQQAVTTFTVSDFGRTLTSNGSGSDHAWGGNQLVMGGAVIGESANNSGIYGTYPSLRLDTTPSTPTMPNLNLSPRGVIIPTTPTDTYFAELALWFGVSKLQLVDVLPNINTFYSSTHPSNPLGFLPTV